MVVYRCMLQQGHYDLGGEDWDGEGEGNLY